MYNSRVSRPVYVYDLFQIDFCWWVSEIIVQFIEYIHCEITSYDTENN